MRACAAAAKFKREKADPGRAIAVIAPVGAEFAWFGYTENPLKDLDMLQKGNWHVLRIAALIWFDDSRSARKTQNFAYEASDEMGWTAREEWLAAPASDVTELVLKAARHARARCCSSRMWMENWGVKLQALRQARLSGRNPYREAIRKAKLPYEKKMIPEWEVQATAWDEARAVANRSNAIASIDKLLASEHEATAREKLLALRSDLEGAAGRGA